MSNRILNYSKWKSIFESKKVNEGLFWDVVEKEFDSRGVRHKVKVKYIDGNSFKVKAVNDRDMVNPNGTIDPTLMDDIVKFLKGHDATDFAREYPALQDLATFYKDNFFTFNVKKENDRRQVIVFTIQKRANFKGVAPEIKAISDDQAAGMTQAPDAKSLLNASDQSLLQNTSDPNANKTGVPTDFKALAIADVVNQGENSPFYKQFDNMVAALATGKVITDKRATDLINKVIAELDAKKLGENSITLIKALMAGFGVGTFVDKYGRTKEQTQITPDMFMKLASFTSTQIPTAQNSSRKYYLGLNGRMIFEANDMINTSQQNVSNIINTPGANTPPPAATTGLPAGFNMDAFINALGGANTGDIKVPDGGFKKGTVAKKDPEFMKFQDLVIKSFSKKLANNAVYKKFASYGADGDYGQTTEKMVAGIKKGFGMKDLDGTTVTPELIDMILKNRDKLNESAYFDLNYRLVEQFDVAGFEEVTKTYKPKKETSSFKVGDEVYASKDMDGFNGSGLTTSKVKFKTGDFLGKITQLLDGGVGANQKVAQITNDAADPSVKLFYSLVDNLTAKGTKPAEKKTDSSGENQIDLNSIASVSIKTDESFVVAMIQTAIDLFGKDWSNTHIDWLVNSFTSLNALAGKFAPKNSSGYATPYDPSIYSEWKDIYTPYISPLTGGDAPMKNQIGKTGLKAVGSAKDTKNINIILSAINTKNNESIIGASDEKALCGAFMLISPKISSGTLDSMAKDLGFEDSGILTAWEEIDTNTYKHAKNLARWAVGALGYSPSQFKGYAIDASEVATLKDKIKSSLKK